MKLTAKTYTDAGLLPTGDAVRKLPSLLNGAEKKHTGEHTRFSPGGSFRVTACHGCKNC